MLVDAFGGTIKVRDDYQAGEILADQSGTGAVLTFTFSTAVQLVVAQSTGTSLTARMDPFGGTPAASLGIRMDDGVPNYVAITCTTVQVFAPVGVTVAVYGMRRA